MPPRVPRNSLPSGAVPNACRCWRSMRARTAGMGTMRMAAGGAVLEAARLERGAGAGPGGAGARAGGGEDDRAAAARREDEVVAAQRDGFFRAQRRVVQAAEE